jgi:hypothetical protein
LVRTTSPQSLFCDRQKIPLFNKLRKLDGKHAKKVTRETAKALKGLPIKTMSNDRGQEFSDHQNYEKKSKVKVYKTGSQKTVPQSYWPLLESDYHTRSFVPQRET